MILISGTGPVEQWSLIKKILIHILRDITYSSKGKEMGGFRKIRIFSWLLCRWSWVYNFTWRELILPPNHRYLVYMSSLYPLCGRIFEWQKILKKSGKFGGTSPDWSERWAGARWWAGCWPALMVPLSTPPPNSSGLKRSGSSTGVRNFVQNLCRKWHFFRPW